MGLGKHKHFTSMTFSRIFLEKVTCSFLQRAINNWQHLVMGEG